MVYKCDKDNFQQNGIFVFIGIDGCHLEQSITYFITLFVWEFAAQVGIKPTYFTSGS